MSAGSDKPLRIGVLLDSGEQVPAFVAQIIEDIQASNFARIELLIVKKSTSGDSATRKPLIYDLYLRLDARMKPENDPLAPVDSRQMLSGIEALELDSATSDATPVRSAEVMEEIRSRNLDVLLHFGSSDPDRIMARATRYGLLAFNHGDSEFFRGGPPYFWELLERSVLSAAALQAVAEQPENDLTLCESQFATEATISVSRNLYAPYWGSTEMVIRKLNELHRFGWEYVLERAMPPVPYRGRRDPYKTPGDAELISWLGPILFKKAIAYPFRREIVQHWRIAIRIGSKPLWDTDSTPDFSGFQWIDAPQGHFWADPFVFEHQGKTWIFFEDFSYRDARGSISCCEISAKGELGPPVMCLEDPRHHYSYPHIFRSGNEIFMIPESYDSNSVDLYRCREFPQQWVHEATLLEGKFVDSTIWEHNGIWWLATTSAEPSIGAGCLLLFYSASPTGEWQFHPANPISTNIRRNRGAGRVFYCKHRLIRPSQSSVPSYGYSVDFNEITELTKERYAERPVRTITAGHWKGLAGVHTYNWLGSLELIDGRSPVALNRVQVSP
jgi:hypothetical protein